MSFSPKPCAHCGGTSFTVLPDVMLEAHKSVQVLGMVGGQKLPGWWKLTIVVCAQCTRTELFSPNAAEMARHVPGAYPTTSTR